MLVSFGIIIFLLSFNVDGDEEAERYRCPGLGEQCNPEFVNPCCGENLECQKIHRNDFVCRKKASSIKINTPIQSNNTARSSLLGGFCKISEHCKPDNSVCINNACQCSSFFTPVSDQTCVRKILGYPCIDSFCGKIPFAKCSDNICKCTQNSVAINSIRCQPTINRTCVSDFSCTVKNSHCIDHKCQCKPHYTSTASQQCLSTKLEQFCSEDADCSMIRNAKCDGNKCICKNDYTNIRNNRCVLLLNNFCSKNYPCPPENFHCIDHTCQCKPNFQLISPAKCISIFDKKTCRKNKDCAELQNSACVNRICECKQNYVRANQTRCDPLLDQPCQKSTECATPNSICIDEVCQCALFYSQRGINLCLSGTLRGSCTKDDDCQEIPNSKCVENKCQCEDGFAEKNVLSCVKSLDGLCTQDKDCFDKTTVCINKRCQCRLNYLPLSESQCRSAYVDKECYHDHDCEVNSFCSNNGVCVCDHNHAPLNGVCAPLLNVSCSPNQHCAVDNAFCIDNKCQCSSEYAPRSNYQCKISYLGNNCKSDIDCSFIKNAKCYDKLCQCRKNHVKLSPTICRAYNGEPCSDDRDCAVTNAFCIYNECHCRPGFVTTRDYCEPPPSRQICIHDDNCTELNTRCSSTGQCVCKPNHPEINGIGCGSWLTDGCIVDQDCLVENSICINDKCQCKSYYVAETKLKCVPIFLGRQCRDDVDCSGISNALCSDQKICACVNGSFAIGYLKCVPSVGKTCVSKQDCVVSFYDCINNKCRCAPTFIAVSGWQCAERNSVFTCTNDLDCGEPWHSKCSRSKKCVCKMNSFATNMSTCRPLLGGYCWKDDQCIPDNSECSNYQCKCKNRFVAAANNLCVPLRGLYLT